MQVKDSAFSEERELMIKRQLQARDIRDPKVLSAMQKVPRHEFIPDKMKKYAYNDEPLPIGDGQTISQPYIVAYMTEILKLEKNHKVLEVGTGSGYQTAVLAEIAYQVYSVEIIASLSQHAQDILLSLGYENIQFKIGDGSLGWLEHAPYDAVIVTAAPAAV
ncbi:MAG: protein-L-isoaspartate(D-aspartate) O-methyltransferase, partial [Candidatus Aminicenantes bacterium]|nr:protein-L-isoaspartate(D-aspartate) O-methyltransferase [Candidatus Aminicenantes bacterium]